MQLYRLTLRLEGPLGTPLVGPTLFGQLCWARRESEGEASLKAWLANKEEIWRLSDGFPHDFLPKPLTQPRKIAPGQLEEAKDRKRRPHVSRAAWLQHRESWSEENIPLSELSGDGARLERRAHNVVHRHGRGTLEEGGLYFLEEDWRQADGDGHVRLDVYVQASEVVSKVRAYFDYIGETGYGRDSSSGRGRFVVESATEDAELQACSECERRMSLSRAMLTPATMADARWKLVPHFGRTGPQVSLAGFSPFKHPVLLTLPGTSFIPTGNGSPGGWIAGLHPQRPEIGLNAFHLAIPYAEAA